MSPCAGPFIALCGLRDLLRSLRLNLLAGAICRLNNTYIFPGLTQRDVIFCIKQRLLVLALDGFDELVARIGVRDAFTRINELLEQLKGSGTLIVSARESFFELYQISAAIRSYLQPREGSYSIGVVKLLPWGREQGIAVFTTLQSATPEKDFSELLSVFEGDETIALHPFFLTRLADLWLKGERFAGVVGQPDSFARIRFIIRTYIDRESDEKWVDRDGKSLLTSDGHMDLLSAVAEEMWQTGAFRLDQEELRIAALLGLADYQIPSGQSEAIKERVPTHAAFASKESRYSFIHDQFFYFFLGRRLAVLLASENSSAFVPLLSTHEMLPSVLDWTAWHWRQYKAKIRSAIEFLDALQDLGASGCTSQNAAELCARLLSGAHDEGCIAVKQLNFIGPALSNRQYSSVTFSRCKFWHIDFCGTKFNACIFHECEFGDILVDNMTSMAGSEFRDGTIKSVEVKEEGSFFAPEEINGRLKQLGCRVIRVSGVSVQQTPLLEIDKTAVKCVDRMVRASNRTCDIAVEEMIDLSGTIAKDIVRIGIDTGVLKEVSKDVSGPRKHFVRFCVDREAVRTGHVSSTGQLETDTFWKDIRKEYPSSK